MYLKQNGAYYSMGFIVGAYKRMMFSARSQGALLFCGNETN